MCVLLNLALRQVHAGADTPRKRGRSEPAEPPPSVNKGMTSASGWGPAGCNRSGWSLHRKLHPFDAFPFLGPFLEVWQLEDGEKTKQKRVSGLLDMGTYPSHI